MKKKVLLVSFCLLFISGIISADTFGTESNQFIIDFVPISGSTNPTSGIPAGDGFTFRGVNHNYRMGTYEITNDQWNKFKADCGTVMGNPSDAYDESPYFTGTNVSTNEVSWYEAAQFVNWLNTSCNHQAAYKFTGTQGQSDYTFAVWGPEDIGYNASNPYRNSNAYYFLPTEDEWVKAAYWNNATLKTYSTKAGESLTQGDGMSGMGWNYAYATGYTDPYGPWDVGSGSEELNGTYDMMGNVWEWMENPRTIGDYGTSCSRSFRGGSCFSSDSDLQSSFRVGTAPWDVGADIGFRVASVPEPGTLVILAFGGLWVTRRRR